METTHSHAQIRKLKELLVLVNLERGSFCPDVLLEESETLHLQIQKNPKGTLSDISQRALSVIAGWITSSPGSNEDVFVGCKTQVKTQRLKILNSNVCFLLPEEISALCHCLLHVCLPHLHLCLCFPSPFFSPSFSSFLQLLNPHLPLTCPPFLLPIIHCMLNAGGSQKQEQAWDTLTHNSSGEQNPGFQPGNCTGNLL